MPVTVFSVVSFAVISIVFITYVFSPAIFLPMCSIMRHIYFIVPLVANEIDRATASIISAAEFLPVFCMAGRYMQINRLSNNTTGAGLNNDWIWGNEFRLRGTSNVDLTIKTGFSDADGHTNISSICRAGNN
jgi:hypothetical protein